MQLVYLFDGNFVVAVHLYLRSQFAEILVEVVGKRVVVIEQQDTHNNLLGYGLRSRAPCLFRIRAAYVVCVGKLLAAMNVCSLL
jgi:hypothetical protein